MRIALAGNPNSGKTTMYNALTGSSEKVGNWAGVTVEKKEHSIKKCYYRGKRELIVVDLPGAYSMSSFTSEESITSTYVKNESPDVIINIVDATNLSRSLFFTTQLLELGVPTVVALNKSDINKKKSTQIDTQLLSQILGCPVVDTISTSSDGLSEVVNKAVEQIGKSQTAPFEQGNIDLGDKAQVENADRRRYEFVNEMVARVEKRSRLTREKTLTDKVDMILGNKWFGIPFFALVMYAVFWISQSGPGVWISDVLTGYLEGFQGWIGDLLDGANPLLYSLLIDGVIGGVIAVIGFLPLVMIMYFLIALLEDCGYMARVSVVLDPMFKKVGLSGKSVIPFVIGTGCAVPGVMACRAIRGERERRATAMLAPFMPCGAKLPVIALFAGVFFPEISWVGPLMYFAGIIIIFFAALIINKITACSAKRSFFIIELPEYKFPSLWGAVKSMCQRGWSFVVKASTIILLCNTVVHIMQEFDWSFKIAESANDSILASVAGPFAYLLFPVVGVLSWQLAAAALTGFIAKENVVGTLAVCFVGLERFINMDELSFVDGGAIEAKALMGITTAAALAYLMFNLFTPPCFAAIGAMSSELKSAKWFWGAIGFQLGTGFTIGFIVYQLGTLFATGSLGKGFFAGFGAVLLYALILIILCIKSDRIIKNKEKA